MRRTIIVALAFAFVPTLASAVEYPVRKAGLWELTMTMTSGRTMRLRHPQHRRLLLKASS